MIDLYTKTYAQITLPEGAAGDITTNASGIISEFSDIWTLILGVLLAALVITFIIKSLR
jgi:hypothetical protein